MKKVYALGVMQLNTAENSRRVIERSRLWSLYANFEDAEKCVLENRGDIFERYYNYALIEETYVIDPSDPPTPGDFSGFPKEWWYFADFTNHKQDDPSEPTVSLCEKPKALDKTVYFWTG